MKSKKQMAEPSTIKKLVAKKGTTFPIRYEGKIVRIGESPVEVDFAKLNLETKHHIKEAQSEGALLESGV